MNLGHGGIPLAGVRWVKHHGISAESDYPYQQKPGNCENIVKLGRVSDAHKVKIANIFEGPLRPNF